MIGNGLGRSTLMASLKTARINSSIRARISTSFRKLVSISILSEFRLTVSTKVFVTEAFNDLVVAVKACAHQHLFEELRRLRQSIEVAVVNTRGNQIVAAPSGVLLVSIGVSMSMKPCLSRKRRKAIAAL